MKVAMTYLIIGISYSKIPGNPYDLVEKLLMGIGQFFAGILRQCRRSAAPD